MALKKTLKVSFILIGGVCALGLAGNHFIISTLSPTSPAEILTSDDYPEKFQKVLDYTGGEPTVLLSEELQITYGLIAPGGYVDVTESESELWVTEGNLSSYRVEAYSLTHEYAHILQKELVAELAGGYPENPDLITSSLYYAKLLELDQQLLEYTTRAMPQEQYHDSLQLMGLEMNADCITQWFSVALEEQTAYLDAPCSNASLAAAHAVINGEWPSEELVASYEEAIEREVLLPPLLFKNPLEESGGAPRGTM